MEPFENIKILLATLVMLLVSILIVTMFTACAPGKNVIYVMPDGAKCRYRSYTGDREFFGCDNGCAYIRPDYYSEEKE